MRKHVSVFETNNVNPHYCNHTARWSRRHSFRSRNTLNCELDSSHVKVVCVMTSTKPQIKHLAVITSFEHEMARTFISGREVGMGSTQYGG